MVTRFALGFAAWLAVSVGVGCDRPACDPIEACDIRRASCQREALRLARCMRDEDAEADIELEVVDYGTFVQDRAKALEGESPDTSEHRFRDGLAAFGLSSVGDAEDEAETRWEWVGAFYSDGKVTVLDRGEALDDAGWTALLVHEMVHALQDASGDLSLLDEATSFDAALAQRSIVEGEAELIGARTLIEGLGFDMDEVDYDRALRRFRRDSLRGSAQSRDAFTQAPRFFAYAFGASLLWNAIERDGADAVRDVYREPPSSTGSIMRDGAPDAEGDIADFEANAAPETTPDLERVGHARLGRFLFETFVRRLGDDAHGDTGTASELGEELVADAMTVLAARSRPSNTVAVWRLRMRNEAAAGRLVALYAQLRPEDRAEADGRDVWLAAGDLESLPADLRFTALEGPDVGFRAEDENALRCFLTPVTWDVADERAVEVRSARAL